MSKWKLISLLLACALNGCTIGKTPLELEGGGPGGGGGTGQGGGRISIAALKEMYVNRAVTITSEYTIQGTVVGSDRWGNFYKTLCIQDDSGGIAIRIDLEEYFRTFALGDVVTVYCNALTLGTYGGAIQLGVLASVNSNEVTYIPEGYLASLVQLEEAKVEPSVKPVTIPGLTPSDISRYVEISGVQFAGWEEGLTWCDGDESDTNRYIVDEEGNRLIVRTSRYAAFGQRVLPSGSGFIRGVAGYFNGEYQLTVINDSYAVMEQYRF